MKYIFLLLILFSLAVLGAFLASEEDTPTENLDNVKTKLDQPIPC